MSHLKTSCAILIGICVTCTSVSGQVTGFDWVTVGAPGNAPFPGPDPIGDVVGRGGVDYVYRIGRTEITTGQWLSFVNTFSTQSDELGQFGIPSNWGARVDTSYTGPGMRWQLRDGADAGMLPVFGVSWRTAAMYCNWLCNGQSSDLISLDTGAYDTSTFHFNEDGTLADQRTHSPGAQYWIPTMDEWLKAAHFDPNRYGPGQSGWWQYSHSSDVLPESGLPGEGETSAGLNLPDFGQFDIPLGAYPDTLSPWGLLDITGGAAEWTEEMYNDLYRGVDGASAGFSLRELDEILHFRIDFPTSRGSRGLRIASVPAPGPVTAIVLTLLLTPRRRR